MNTIIIIINVIIFFSRRNGVYYTLLQYQSRHYHLWLLQEYVVVQTSIQSASWDRLWMQRLLRGEKNPRERFAEWSIRKAFRRELLARSDLDIEEHPFKDPPVSQSASLPLGWSTGAASQSRPARARDHSGDDD